MYIFAGVNTDLSLNCIRLQFMGTVEEAWQIKKQDDYFIKNPDIFKMTLPCYYNKLPE